LGVLLVRLGVGGVYRLECRRSLARNSVFGMNRSGVCRVPVCQLGPPKRGKISKLTGSRFGTAS
jgi:hypothetical protein